MWCIRFYNSDRHPISTVSLSNYCLSAPAAPKSPLQSSLIPLNVHKVYVPRAVTSTLSSLETIISNSPHIHTFYYHTVPSSPNSYIFQTVLVRIVFF